MNLADLFPKNGEVQRIYCNRCSTHCDLAFSDFEEDISGILISVEGLPSLRCPSCGYECLPDKSKLSLIRIHQRASDLGKKAENVTRQKIKEVFDFAKVSFIYDPDDYYYIPGLCRKHDIGFLTPVFFNKEVLIKYDVHPSYRVKFASQTYGEIVQNDDFSIAFGINRSGRLVMWLGDIATLPENEQHYLRSENVPSDHSIGSEFYDGQIECKFTDRTPEDILFEERSRFLEAAFRRFGQKIAHLEKEVLDLLVGCRKPVVDTESERRSVADVLNKVCLESLDNLGLAKLIELKSHKVMSTGSLKRLQQLLEISTSGIDVSRLMNPLYVLYDLRVAYSHLLSVEGRQSKLDSVFDRLSLSRDADLASLYDKLISELSKAFGEFADAL